MCWAWPFICVLLRAVRRPTSTKRSPPSRRQSRPFPPIPPCARPTSATWGMPCSRGFPRVRRPPTAMPRSPPSRRRSRARRRTLRSGRDFSSTSASCLGRRFDSGGVPADLDASIRAFEEALELTPVGSPDRPGYLAQPRRWIAKPLRRPWGVRGPGRGHRRLPGSGRRHPGRRPGPVRRGSASWGLPCEGASNAAGPRPISTRRSGASRRRSSSSAADAPDRPDRLDTLGQRAARAV